MSKKEDAEILREFMSEDPRIYELGELGDYLLDLYPERYQSSIRPVQLSRNHAIRALRFMELWGEVEHIMFNPDRGGWRLI